MNDLKQLWIYIIETSSTIWNNKENKHIPYRCAPCLYGTALGVTFVVL